MRFPIIASAVLLGVSSSCLHCSAFVIPKSCFEDHSARRTGPTRTPLLISKTDASNIEAVLPSNDDYEGEDISKTDFVVCGGGPAGLLSAIMLANKFPNQKVKLYDRLQPPPKPTDEDAWSDVARFYLIGLGSRGQRALESYNVLNEVDKFSVKVIGRKDWAPDAEEGVERIFDDRKVQTIVMPRDKLVGVLHEHILQNYNNNQIELNHGYEIQPVNFEYSTTQDGTSNRVLLRASQCSPAVSNVAASEEKTAQEQQEDVLCDTQNSTLISAQLLIAADGTVRTIANAIQAKDEQEKKSSIFGKRPLQVKRFPDDNRRIYKTIPMTLPPDWRGDVNYSARSKSSRVVFDALPANDQNQYCGVLLLRETDELAKPNTDPAALRRELDESLPQFSAIVDDEVVATVAKKPPSYLPGFRYVGPRLHEGDNTIILGDCAHTVKPYFGLGANSALEDVRILGDIIDETDTLSDAVRKFSKTRAIEAKKLVTISRELDRPGGLGFITFILPIILDAIFHKSFPKVFSPNVITMLQRDDLTFKQVARKKRMDRLAQVGILVGSGYGMVAGTKFVLKSIAKALGRKTSTVTAGIGAAMVGIILLQKLLPFLVPGLAPADVMTRTDTPGKS
ncbi:Kynurenine 3-monooxygenase [Seminavis robusta]|uniref:Kynurenine 3-monooxygenase n=1 Tax=Seminavis robusta TaxID=568900 RepID=A0A9N8HFM2_9STRA|nr:Kynurenine 3-monooxygenase [Seminavis robusta]|eukprot:Sro355_g125150.1 Kynurenine 3-monooxygenase (622) ;mRNA; f:65702-67774